uniref:Uncharacterized protein n=1 Tax=Acrobeloides nanus TaxID=290746 RepID=A0A914CLE8_9BILA
MFWGDLAGALPGVFVFGFEGNWSMFYYHYDSTYEPSFGNLIHMTNFVVNAFYILGICIFVSYVVIIFSWAQILRCLRQKEMSTVGGKTTENVTRRPSIQPPPKDNGQLFERRNTVTVS